MKSRRTAVLALPLLAFAMSLGGCVAALIPVVASGAIAKSRVDAANQPPRDTRPRVDALAALPRTLPRERTEGTAAPAPTPGGDAPTLAAPEPVVRSAPVAEFAAASSPKPSLVLTPLTSLPPPSAAAASDPRRAIPALDAIIAGREEQMASGYPAFADFAAKQAGQAEFGSVEQVLLAPGFSLDDPRFLACAGKPPAVLIDLDNRGSPFTPATDRVAAPGLTEALARLATARVKVLWLTSRAQGDAAAMRAALLAAGVGNPLLVLAEPGQRKQQQRQDTGSAFCVVAIAGDRKSDFDELYDYLREDGKVLALDRMWDAGWFVLPPPFSEGDPAA